MNSSPEELLFIAASNFDDQDDLRAFLQYACRDDEAMRGRLEKMLAIKEDAATFFEFQPEYKPQPKQEGSPEGIGGRIGRYRLISRLGAGGCGVVYLAEQEEPVRRKVALKIIKLGMDTEAVIARFAQERQALAQMDHPNIARVLDAGATDSGRPYFVMELVEGERITEFCDTNHLNVRQRLELFVQVCHAIQHAHQKGVIHRDIKPSNVLVRMQDGVPVPKVIDFGIAKATAANGLGGATATQAGQFLGTPAYMSPEQAGGSADVDTRSDIYSLGALVYELLCGQTPFDFHRLPDKGVDEVRRIIRETEPKAPSTVLKSLSVQELNLIGANRGTEPQKLTAQLSGDLDWIVAKALEKERSRRYESASGLAADVRRFLLDEIVMARPPSRAYRFGKLVRRNKLVFATGAIAACALLSGFSFSTVMYFRERSARMEQERLEKKAESRSFVSNAAVKVKYGDMEGADALLAKVPKEQVPSSLEAAQTFGAVANWHMQAGRLKEAAFDYMSMIRAIASVDKSDLPSVSVNLLPAAATVTYAGEVQSYEEIRRMAMERFGGTNNGAVAEQTLKACLLLPADEKTLQSLRGLVGIVQRDIEQKSGDMGKDFHYTAWGCFAMALWNYRTGEFAKASQWAERSLAFPNDNEARIASVLIVRAMIEKKTAQPEKAGVSLAQGREAVQRVFTTREWMHPKFPVSWFEWLNAALLLTEAEKV